MACDYGKYGIRVNAINPGTVSRIGFRVVLPSMVGVLSSYMYSLMLA
jgi:NAD(P)-dependent dehydrogenase (short-subunit alcohol dehydrogenase family)